ncbi:nucleotidyltransferase domain-containing protein [Methylobacterium sp. Leaf117]|uniref:nucleotidyltransferase family protein n=1 Tax=Methylobacterium sp. Leaf117 TaxID=1736260 RepID=UPI0006F2B0AE|nr:nucleotidyltransferase domain-containing protein [Methylobacterium sp. Leaf117]KQP82789.1 DNA polymerase III subunit beta [Methylobacterium sp. Leaf117]
MDRDAAIAILRAHAPALRERGISHAALFGSTARGEAHATSDVDVVIDLDDTLKLDVYGYVGLCHLIADLFPVAVDVVDRKTLKDRVRARIERDAIPVF